MKIQLLSLAAIVITAAASGQTLVDSGSFFDPDFQARRAGAASGVLSVTVNNTPVTASNASGNQSWNHSAGGFAQLQSQIDLGLIQSNLDAQLAAYTRTSGDSLVFGREITTDADILGLGVGPALQVMANQVAGASVIYNWQSGATVSGLAIVPDQLYQVDFTVTSGSGLPVNLLQSASFGITTADISGASDESATLLNLLNIITLGNNSSTGNFSFVFKSTQNKSALDFSFAASTGVGVSLLGGTAGNQNVLTFSGFQVTAVPEPSGLMLCGLSATFLVLRRKRNA